MGDSNAYKVCPNCRTAAYLGVPVCGTCGHQFQTQFSPPPNQTQAFYGQSNPNWDPYQGQYPLARPDSNRLLITLLLWFFLGHFGAHRLYLGHTNSGILMLVLALIGYATICLVVGVFVLLGVAVWWVIDLVQMLTGNLRHIDGTRLT